MKTKQRLSRLTPTVFGNERGFLLVAAMVLVAILTVMGTTAFLYISTDMKIGGNFRNSQQVLQVATAGAEHGRERLRSINASNTGAFTDPTTLNAELVYHAGPNGTFELNASGSDDIPLITSTALGAFSYIIYLTNDAADNAAPIADSNNRVVITSIATGPNNARATVETMVSLPAPPSAPPPSGIPNPPGAVTMLGNDSSFIGGNSNAKSLNGDDQCGSVAPLPVVAVSAPGSLANVQSAIDGSQPGTYHTKLANGTSVSALTHPNEISKAISAAQASAIQSAYGVDINSASSLNNMVETIRNNADSVVAGGSSSSSVDLGNTSNLRAVVVDGDFTMNGGASGAGLLVVKGQLTFAGNINYTGMIMVIGKGIMIRNGGGNGTISGAVWVANTAGPDGVPGNGDDTMGMAVLNTSGAGASNIQHCSSAVNNAAALVTPPPAPSNSPLIVSSFRQILN